ncbi:hypothetical protein [Vibrio tasmaniensis]|uniref:hypothetical protein n=1 Tax=Vibrio tasmaniensis TaxID=212663 RepID=UPI00111B90CB|nr:hypothetical protein [Vibrio tasmaniensis]
MNKPNVDDIFSLIGAALVYAQSLESLMKLCTTYVLQEEESINFEKLTRLQKREKKKTLGYFVGRIKDRADVHPNLLQLIESFLENRNMLVHNIDSIPNWDLSTNEGTEVAKQFVGNLISQTSILTQVFTALVSAWQQQIDLEVEHSEAEQQILNEIQLKYGSIVDELFTQKET